MGELKRLVDEGKIKYNGLSEAAASTIRRADAVHPITAVHIEAELVPTCRELGIGIVPYSPLGRSFLSAGSRLIQNLCKGDVRKIFPRFQGENFEHSKLVHQRILQMAERKGCTPSQLALAWVHHQGDDVSPIPGTTRIQNFNDNIGALVIELSVEEMAEISSLGDLLKGDRHAFMNNT